MSTAASVAESIRHHSSLPLRVPTVHRVQRWRLLKSRGKCRCLSLWDELHRLSVGWGRSRRQRAHSGSLGMAGVLGFWFGFSFPKIGVLVAIVLASKHSCLTVIKDIGQKLG
ncbi:hypothetical protein NDI43_24660 [Microcoleus vaginatus GB2-A3]|uniref:hypothetical protein n=1 Tax=Microcoleus vaginatus TaxID=119532 RepID=UPI0032A7B9CA